MGVSEKCTISQLQPLGGNIMLQQRLLYALDLRLFPKIASAAVCQRRIVFIGIISMRASTARRLRVLGNHL